MLNRPMRFRAPTIPTVEEVRAYMDKIGFICEAEAFTDYYGARGWHISRNVPLLDWQAMVRTWQRRGTGPMLANVGQSKPEQYASLGALQVQLKRVEDELNDMLYPGGAAFKQTPRADQMPRYIALMEQRKSLKERMSKF